MNSLLFILITFFYCYFFFQNKIKLGYLWVAAFCFIYINYLLLQTSVLNSMFEFQFFLFKLNFINFYWIWSLDFISLWFVWLTIFLWIISILCVWNLKYKSTFLLHLLFLLNFILINVFFVSDIFFFYVFFEALLIPMFLLIGVWGSRERRVYAAFIFFLYTLFGSLIMLFALFLLYSHFGLLDSRLLYLYNISEERQIIFWLAFFVSVAIKVPMFPVHIWLPEAHVEAPTVGSIILAGILLKLGVFGLIKFLFPIFTYATFIMSPYITILSLVGVLYASFSTIIQIDMKKLVAYSSIAHMNFAVLGLFCFNYQGFIGSLTLMLSHGLVSSGLFFCVNVLYERYKTRLLLYFGGLSVVMPLFFFYFFVLILANMSFPGTFSFIGEFTVLIGIAFDNIFMAFLAGLSMVFSAIYSLILFSAVMLGKLNNNFIKLFGDLTKREFVILTILVFFVIFFGLFANIILYGLYAISPFYLDFILSYLI